MKDLLTEILFYFQEFQNERQHHRKRNSNPRYLRDCRTVLL